MPVEGEPFHAELSAVDANWQLTFIADQKQRTMPAAELVCWGQCPEQGRGGPLVLADGGLLTAEVVAADKEKLTVDSDSLGDAQTSAGIARRRRLSSARRSRAKTATSCWTASARADRRRATACCWITATSWPG